MSWKFTKLSDQVGDTSKREEIKTRKFIFRSHAVWEMVMNELDRREDPNIEEDIPGCAMVDSCSSILTGWFTEKSVFRTQTYSVNVRFLLSTGDQFYAFLNHNFERHYEQNRAPLGLYFHAAWLKNNPEFLDAFLCEASEKK